MEGLNAALARIGARPARQARLSGGDLSQVLRVDTADGRRIVAKAGPLVAVEARMLAAMAETGAPVPRVLALEGRVMLIEALEETAPMPAGWAALGRGLARLHRAPEGGGAGYGWEEDYAFGPLPIANAPLEDWPGFWAARRLLATDAPADLRARLETLARRLPDLLPARPAPALLHGDMWTGNALFAGDAAWLIDPACYRGHHEVDLAMLTLFARPPETFWRAYGRLDPGSQARRALYQLWPALVHLHLFGTGYRGMVEGLLARLGA